MQRTRLLIPALVALLPLAFSGCGKHSESRAIADESEVEALAKVFSAGGKKPGGEAPAAAAFMHSGGFQTVKGRVRFDGAAPARKSTNASITKDQAVCAPAGHDHLSEQLIVNPANGGIANVVIFVKTEKNRPIPVHDSAKNPPAAAPTLDNRICQFEPHVLVVHRGLGKLTLANKDSVDHNMNIQPRVATGSNSTLAKNSTGTYEMSAEEAQPFPVTCTIHTWMKGYLQMRDNGYFAVTDKDGNFKIENLPTGDKLTIQVWHEAAGSGTGGFVNPLTVNGGAAAVTQAKGGFAVNLDKDAALPDLELVVPPAAPSGS